MLEKEIERRVCKYAATVGLDNYKFSSPNRIGVPDRMFIGKNAHLFFVEFKRDGGKATVVQEREMQKLVDAGFNVYVVTSVEQGRIIINNELGRN